MNVFALADRYLPAENTNPDRVRQLRAVVLGSMLGLFFSTLTSASYLLLGSVWSALSILFISIGLAFVPMAIRRGVPSQALGHLMTALTAQAAVVVSFRSGGFSSPAVTWCFMLPIVSYLACGRRAAIAWSVVAMAIIGGFFAAERTGLRFGEDFTAEQLSLLRMSGYPGLITSNLAILMLVDRIRMASQRALDEANRGLERQRILHDMHDGVGSQLVGLLARARSGQVDGASLVRELESCIDDLRLAVDSLDPSERSLEVALGELRHRTQVHCEAAGLELTWHSDTNELVLPADTTLDVLRACQELLSNSIRHAGARRIEFSLTFESERRERLRIAIRDDGVGFDEAAPPRIGRGLSSLRTRANKLGGQLAFLPLTPGIEIAFTLDVKKPHLV